MNTNFENFSCKRIFLDNVKEEYERNLLIHSYCSSEFAYINYVDFYYRKLNTNAILMVLLMLIWVPFFYYQISLVTSRFLTPAFLDIRKKFHLSPNLGTVLIVSTANQSPNLFSVSSFKIQEQGLFLNLGTFLGSFIFSFTMGLGSVISLSKGVP